MLRRIELLVDDDDFDAIHAEIRRRERFRRAVDPGGRSDPLGRMVAEVVRELEDYRSILERTRPA